MQIHTSRCFRLPGSSSTLTLGYLLSRLLTFPSGSSQQLWELLLASMDGRSGTRTDFSAATHLPHLSPSHFLLCTPVLLSLFSRLLESDLLSEFPKPSTHKSCTNTPLRLHVPFSRMLPKQASSFQPRKHFHSLKGALYFLSLTRLLRFNQLAILPFFDRLSTCLPSDYTDLSSTFRSHESLQCLWYSCFPPP